MFKQNKNKNGFTIIEVLAAVFFVSIGMIGVLTVIQQTMTYVDVSSSRLTAIYLAQEGIEIVRNIRDGNWLEQRLAPATLWTEGLTNCSAGCEIDYNNFNQPTAEDPNLQAYGGGRYLKLDPATGLYNYTPGEDTKFKRKISITEDGSDKLRVLVEVFWEAKGERQISAEEILYNWRQ